jgi:hypothetical protein
MPLLQYGHFQKNCEHSVRPYQKGKEWLVSQGRICQGWKEGRLGEHRLVLAVLLSLRVQSRHHTRMHYSDLTLNKTLRIKSTGRFKVLG